MDTTTEGTIVVGVTGPGRETAALRFAADCARRERAEVVLVHAYGAVLPPPPPSVLMTYSEAADVAEWVVAGVGEEFEQLTGGAVVFRTVAVVGKPSHVLVDVGRRARMVVVQHRDAHLLERLFVGSTVNGAAAHCECPVVSVPLEWESRGASAAVVVGVHEGATPRQVLEAGLDWAAATGAPLRVVHAWRLDAAYDDIITDQVAAEWHAEQVQALESAVSELSIDRPSVSVDVEVRHQWPAQALVGESRHAALVVVGRHGRHGRGTTRLGSVTRTVLREATSPVMVVPLTPLAHALHEPDVTADEVSPQT